MSLSTHVLDAGTGLPADGVGVALERRVGDGWEPVTDGRTDTDGRIANLGSAGAGVHRIRFDTGGYFQTRDIATFYPEVSVVFEITDPKQHLHVPLLLSPFAYSTYRGS